MNTFSLPEKAATDLRERIFALQSKEKLEITATEWTVQESLLFNVQTRRKTNRETKKGSWDHYYCRLHVDSRNSSTADPDIPAEKRRVTSTRVRDCEATLKVHRFANRPGFITLEATDGHNHSLQTSDLLKTPQFVTDVVKEEAGKGYKAVAIKAAVGPALTANEATSSTHITYQHAANVTRKAQEQTTKRFTLPKGGTLESDIRDAVSMLEAVGWHAGRFSGPSETGEVEGIAFASDKHISHLQNYGVLVLMDATHKANSWDWYLFVLTVRDKYGEWQRGGYFLCNRENNEAVALGLSLIKGWTQGRWIPRNFLIDNSSIEKKGILRVFPGLQASEQQVDIVLCTVHSLRTLMCKIGHLPKVLSKMIGAMHRVTKANCEMMVQEAIALVPASQKHIRDYLRNYWLSCTHEWALYARQHSPLLLQITTTNSGEAHNRVIKTKGKRG